MATSPSSAVAGQQPQQQQQSPQHQQQSPQHQTQAAAGNGAEVRMQQEGEIPTPTPTDTPNANEQESSQVSTAPPGTAITSGSASGSSEPMDTTNTSDAAPQQMGQAQQTNGILISFKFSL